MSIFQIGPLVKSRREELGYSQEDLADGICSVPTLSRIESGERMPTRNHFEMLVQRLGLSKLPLDFFTSNQDFRIHELKYNIRFAYIEQNYSLAKESLDELEQVLQDPTPVDMQFNLLYHTLLYKERYSIPERLQRYEKALLLTCPKYRDNCFPRLMSFEEITVLNNIAVTYDAMENYDKACSILYFIKRYYDNHFVSVEEARRTQPMILFNLSTCLGKSGRYDECIEICDIEIRLAKKTGRTSHLGLVLFNRAWSMIKRDYAGDQQAAKIYMRQACFFSDIMGQTQNAKRMRECYFEFFGEELPRLI